MIAHLITIGDEILIGQIVDTNSAWMAQQLNYKGIEVREIISISDTKEDIIRTLDESLKRADLVLLTGGLGPTKDDITKNTLAEYFNLKLSFHQKTYDGIIDLFKRFDRETTPAHRIQSYMPEGAIILDNKVGTAPGMWFEKDNKVVVSMPGVPSEMKYLMEQEVLPLLSKKFVGKPISHRTLLTIGEGESRLAARIANIEEQLPSHIKLAYLPGIGQVRLRLTGRGENAELLDQDLNQLVDVLKEEISDLIFGYETDSIEAVIGKMLVEQEKTLSIAESCSGGYLSHQITAIPGCSAYYEGSVVAYSNTLKTNLLNVPPEILETHGAVSEQTVKAMVKGVIKLMKTDIGIGISGIAGPGGGTPEKPVGTIWIAVGDENRIETWKLQLGKTRLLNIKYTATKALEMLRRYLLLN